jgi:ParB-like chromosome segregation protein Spo0J
MTKAQQFLEMAEPKEISISKIKLEKDIVLVDTRDSQSIIDAYGEGKMPLDKARVEAFSILIKQGHRLPPVVLSKNKLLRDGHHRYAAYKLAGKTTIPYED